MVKSKKNVDFKYSISMFVFAQKLVSTLTPGVIFEPLYYIHSKRYVFDFTLFYFNKHIIPIYYVL